MFVELDSRQIAGLTVSLEWDRDTGRTQVVVTDIRVPGEMLLPVQGDRAAHAFRHPFGYAP